MSRTGLSLTLLVILGLPALAAPPPTPADLEKLLKQEPIAATSWPAWSPRLREWANEDFEATFPAYQKAFDFIRTQVRTSKISPLTKPLDNDPVALMLLAGAYLHDAKPAQGPVPTGRNAADAARRSLRFDVNLARSHFYLCWGLQMEQLAPPEQGGPARPDRNRLREALKALKQARALAPAAHWLPHTEAAALAIHAQQWDDAELFQRLALQEKPNDIELARQLARSVDEQVWPQYRRDQPFAPAIEPLVRKFPDDGILACWYARGLAQDNRRDEAAQQLARARKLGIDPGTIIDPKLVQELEQEHTRKQGELAQQQKEADVQRQLEAAPRWVLWAVGLSSMSFTVFYGGVMTAMCLAGLVLARRTRGPLAADLLGSVPGAPAARGQVFRTRQESSLTRWYVLLLLAGLVLFYAALPLVLFGLLIVFLALLPLAILTVRAPGSGDFHVDLLRASGGGVWAVFKALFARGGVGNFGVRKDRTQCPRLFQALDDVARRVDTEPPDEVWISPGAEFSVCQGGRGPFGVFGARKRVLTLGLCVLHFLSIGEFKSILAHEFAHFSHADTFWNRFVFQVNLSLRTATREMARSGGWVTWCNPFYWFFFLYSKSYSLLSAGFSRSREFLADRMACTVCGSDVFGSALQKVCTDGGHFEQVIYKNIVLQLRQNQAFVNMYLAFRKLRNEVLSEDERQRLHQRLLEERPSLFASHPTFQERIAASQLLLRAKDKEDAPAWQLFEDPESTERELTDFLTAAVAERV